jgi:hypothetical protein
VRVVSNAHRIRNQNEYEGLSEITATLLRDLLRAATKIEAKVNSLAA